MRIDLITAEDDYVWAAKLISQSEPWVSFGRTYEYCLTTFKDSFRSCYLASIDGARAGLLILDWSGPFRTYIQAVCLPPSFRGKGIGSALVVFAEEIIFKKCANAFLCYSDFNPGAGQFYSKLGYEEVGVLHDYLIPGHDEILMRKTVGPVSTFQPHIT